jgi:DNA-binding MarR family transcriptional regulator
MSRGLPKTAAAAKLLDEARGLSGDFDRLSQAVAGKVGLSQQDLLAMDLISRDQEVTAGQLARELNLTTGAITGLIDRLEKAGLARRANDPNDRRRVLVKATPKEERISQLYRPLALGLRRTIDDYSEEELAMLAEFLGKLRSALRATTESISR